MLHYNDYCDMNIRPPLIFGALAGIILEFTTPLYFFTYPPNLFDVLVLPLLANVVLANLISWFIGRSFITVVHVTTIVVLTHVVLILMLLGPHGFACTFLQCGLRLLARFMFPR